MKTPHILLVVAGLVGASGWVQAQSMDPLQVRSMAASCANCHGTHGIAEAGNESLAGVNKDELLKKMLDFKTGKKPATIMHQLSKGYSDEQLAALASYFSALKK
ncbi:MAG: class I cytochrome c [Rhodoferax sp.]|nr:class I cytochrome c [Rhodoferax sp.]